MDGSAPNLQYTNDAALLPLEASTQGLNRWAGGPQLPSFGNCGSTRTKFAPCPTDSFAFTIPAPHISSHSLVTTGFPTSPILQYATFFVQALERTRRLYRMHVCGFVVMPEHVHLLISEPERGAVATAVQSLKIASAKRGKRTLATQDTQLRFWQKRYYDRNHGLPHLADDCVNPRTAH
jgi:hypothetical protein